MTSSDMMSPSIRTLQMKADELNYMSVYFYGHSMTSLEFIGHFFHPKMASKKLKLKKTRNLRVELWLVPLICRKIRLVHHELTKLKKRMKKRKMKMRL